MKNESIVLSFKNAFSGIYLCIKKERNMFIHIIIMLIVILAGIFFKISSIEWIICILLFAMVLASECINTALENTVDICSPEINQLAKIAKDSAAGAVLIFAISSVIVGLIIFIPYIIKYFN